MLVWPPLDISNIADLQGYLDILESHLQFGDENVASPVHLPKLRTALSGTGSRLTKVDGNGNLSRATQGSDYGVPAGISGGQRYKGGTASSDGLQLYANQTNSDSDPSVDIQNAGVRFKGIWGAYPHGYWFNGANGYITNAGFTQTINSVSFWVYLTANNKTILNFGTNMTIGVNSSNVVTLGSAITGSTVYVNGVATTAFTLNQLNHIVVTFAEITPTVLELGRASTTYMAGYCYGLRIYNYALTAAEVKSLFNNGLIGADFNYLNTIGNAKYGGRKYLSDFSAGADGWDSSPSNVAVAGNIDSISDGTTSYDNVLRITCNSTNGIHYFLTQWIGVNPVVGETYRIKFKYYMPSANSDVNGFYLQMAGSTQIRYWSANNVNQSLAYMGAWTEIDFLYTVAGTPSSQFRFYLTKDGVSWAPFQDAGGDDLVYFRDIYFEKIGCVLDLDMETGGNYSVLDKSTNAFHGTVSGAVPISREQIVKAVRATITGDTALTNIVPFGYRTKILADVKQGGGAGKKLNIGTSAGGAQVVNDFEFAANGLYNLTLVNPGAFSLTTNQTLYVNDDTTATAWSDTTALSFDLYFILEKVV